MAVFAALSPHSSPPAQEGDGTGRVRRKAACWRLLLPMLVRLEGMRDGTGSKKSFRVANFRWVRALEEALYTFFFFDFYLTRYAKINCWIYGCTLSSPACVPESSVLETTLVIHFFARPPYRIRARLSRVTVESARPCQECREARNREKEASERRRDGGGKARSHRTYTVLPLLHDEAKQSKGDNPSIPFLPSWVSA